MGNSPSNWIGRLALQIGPSDSLGFRVAVKRSELVLVEVRNRSPFYPLKAEWWTKCNRNRTGVIIRDSVRHNKLVYSVCSMKLLKLFVLNNLLFQCYSLKGYDLWSRTWWSNGCFDALSQGERRFWGDTECVGTLCFLPRFEMAILERNILM